MDPHDYDSMYFEILSMLRNRNLTHLVESLKKILRSEGGEYFIEKLVKIAIASPQNWGIYKYKKEDYMKFRKLQMDAWQIISAILSHPDFADIHEKILSELIIQANINMEIFETTGSIKEVDYAIEAIKKRYSRCSKDTRTSKKEGTDLDEFDFARTTVKWTFI